MGNQSRREYTRRVIEHIVPIGADMADLGRAWDAARLEYLDLNYCNGGPSALPDDWARLDADDEYVIIRIETEEPREVAEAVATAIPQRETP